MIVYAPALRVDTDYLCHCVSSLILLPKSSRPQDSASDLWIVASINMHGLSCFLKQVVKSPNQMWSSSWNKQRSHGYWRKRCFGGALQVNKWEVALTERATWQSSVRAPFLISQDCVKGPSLLNDRCVCDMPHVRLCDISILGMSLPYWSCAPFSNFRRAEPLWFQDAHLPVCVQLTLSLSMIPAPASLMATVYLLIWSAFCGLWHFKPALVHTWDSFSSWLHCTLKSFTLCFIISGPFHCTSQASQVPRFWRLCSCLRKYCGIFFHIFLICLLGYKIQTIQKYILKVSFILHTLSPTPPPSCIHSLVSRALLFILPYVF